MGACRLAVAPLRLLTVSQTLNRPCTYKCKQPNQRPLWSARHIPKDAAPTLASACLFASRSSSMSIANTPEQAEEEAEEGEDGAPPSLPDDLTFWSISPDDLTFWSISPAPMGEDRGPAQHGADQSSEPSLAADPFGFRGTMAFGDAVERMERDIDRRRHWIGPRHYSSPRAACPKWLVAIFSGVSHALSASPKAIGWNADLVAHRSTERADDDNDNDDKDDDNGEEEESGSLKAAGMTKSWTRTELVFCYTLCVNPSVLSWLALCSSHSVPSIQLTRPAPNLIPRLPTHPLTTSLARRKIEHD